ncbi:hypothetical protein NMG60_11000087 [Bertholletia excelsa]
MLSSSPDPQNSLQIKQDDKFFSKLLSKEAAPSFRVYYGGASSAVPFLWESQPGTPKHAFADVASLRPLTPPPSFYSHKHKQPTKKHSRSNLLNTLFIKFNLKKPTVWSSSFSSSSSSSTSSSSLSSSSSSMSVPAMPSTNGWLGRFSSVRSSFDDEDGSIGSPTKSVLCFGIGMGGGKLRRAYSAVVVKKALLAVGGRGSV